MDYFEIKKRRTEYLGTLVAGSKTFFLGYLEFSRPLEVTVERVTKTQIIIKENSKRFNREDGMEIGSTYYRKNKLVDPETATEVERHEDSRRLHNDLVYKMSTTKWSSFDNEALQKISDFVDGLKGGN